MHVTSPVHVVDKGVGQQTSSRVVTSGCLLVAQSSVTSCAQTLILVGAVMLKHSVCPVVFSLCIVVYVSQPVNSYASPRILCKRIPAQLFFTTVTKCCVRTTSGL